MRRYFLLVLIITSMLLPAAVSVAGDGIKAIPIEKMRETKPIAVLPPAVKQSEETKKLLDEIAAANKGLFTSDAKGSFTMNFRMGTMNTKIYHKGSKNKFSAVNKFGYPFINAYDNAVQYYSPAKNEITEYTSNYTFKLEYNLQKEDEEDSVAEDLEKKQNLIFTIFPVKNSPPKYELDIDFSEFVAKLKDFTGKIYITDAIKDGEKILKVEAHRREGGIILRFGVNKQTKHITDLGYYKNKLSYISIEDIKVGAEISDSVFKGDTGKIAEESISYKKGLTVKKPSQINISTKKGFELASIDDYDESITYDDVKKMDKDFDISLKFIDSFGPKYYAFNKKVLELKDEEKFLKYMKELENFIDGQDYASDKDRNKAKAVLYYNLSQFYVTAEKFKPSMRAINKSIMLDPEGADGYKEYKGKVLLYEQMKKSESKKSE